LLGLLEPENGGDIFFRNIVEAAPNYMALQPEKSYSSWSPLFELQVWNVVPTFDHNGVSAQITFPMLLPCFVAE
jgi:hypothetical protein